MPSTVTFRLPARLSERYEQLKPKFNSSQVCIAAIEREMNSIEGETQQKIASLQIAIDQLSASEGDFADALALLEAKLQELEGQIENTQTDRAPMLRFRNLKFLIENPEPGRAKQSTVGVMPIVITKDGEFFEEEKEAKREISYQNNRGELLGYQPLETSAGWAIYKPVTISE